MAHLLYSDIKAKALPARWWHASASILPNFVAVLGLHRSGSSCLAGVLHKLGVHMGDRLGGYERTGGFEGVGLARLCEAAYPFPSTVLRIPRKDLCARLEKHILYVRRSARSKHLSAAGGKYPHLCAMGSELQEVCGDALRVLNIERPVDASIRSLQLRSVSSSGWLRISKREAAMVQRWLWRKKQRFLATHDHLTVNYAGLLQNPTNEIERVVDYLNIHPTPAQFQAAVAHVRPTLCHHGI